MRNAMLPMALGMLMLLPGCSTTGDLLRLQRDKLQLIEKNVTAARDRSLQGAYDPSRYDAYLALNATLFQQILVSFDGTKADLDISGRPVSITVNSVRTDFRPGSPQITLDAIASDARSGIQAQVEIDSRLVITRTSDDPEQLQVAIVATRIVPRVSWGPFEITKLRFARALLTLEAERFTSKLPTFTLPLGTGFAFGEQARTIQSDTIPTGEHGGWIRGNLSYPATLTTGRFAIKEILFLENGVHVFANVEGV